MEKRVLAQATDTLGLKAELVSLELSESRGYPSKDRAVGQVMVNGSMFSISVKREYVGYREREEGGSEYKVTVYPGDGLDTKTLESLGIEVDWTDVISKFTELRDAQMEREKEEDRVKKGQAWDGSKLHLLRHKIINAPLDVSLNFSHTREEFMEGVFGSFFLLIKATYKKSEKEYIAEVNDKGQIELRTDRYNKVKTSKVPERVATALQSDIGNWKGRINRGIERAKESKDELAKVQEELDGFPITKESESKWSPHGGPRRGRHYTVEYYQFMEKVITRKKVESEEWSERVSEAGEKVVVKFYVKRFKDDPVLYYSLVGGEDVGFFTAEQFKQFLSLVRTLKKVTY